MFPYAIPQEPAPEGLQRLLEERSFGAAPPYRMKRHNDQPAGPVPPPPFDPGEPVPPPPIETDGRAIPPRRKGVKSANVAGQEFSRKPGEDVLAFSDRVNKESAAAHVPTGIGFDLTPEQRRLKQAMDVLVSGTTPNSYQAADAHQGQAMGGAAQVYGAQEQRASFKDTENIRAATEKDKLERLLLPESQARTQLMRDELEKVKIPGLENELEKARILSGGRGIEDKMRLKTQAEADVLAEGVARNSPGWAAAVNKKFAENKKFLDLNDDKALPNPTPKSGDGTQAEWTPQTIVARLREKNPGIKTAALLEKVVSEQGGEWADKNFDTLMAALSGADPGMAKDFSDATTPDWADITNLPLIKQATDLANLNSPTPATTVGGRLSNIGRIFGGKGETAKAQSLMAQWLAKNKAKAAAAPKKE